MRTSRVLVAVAARSLAGTEEDVSLGQFRALVVLASRGPQRPVDLAAAMGIAPSTATRLCDRLVWKRLITRRRLEADRREVQLDLTDKARDLVASVMRRRRIEIRRIVAKLPEDQRERLIDALTMFSDAVGEPSQDDWHRSWDI